MPQYFFPGEIALGKNEYESLFYIGQITDPVTGEVHHIGETERNPVLSNMIIHFDVSKARPIDVGGAVFENKDGGAVPFYTEVEEGMQFIGQTLLFFYYNSKIGLRVYTDILTPGSPDDLLRMIFSVKDKLEADRFLRNIPKDFILGFIPITKEQRESVSPFIKKLEDSPLWKMLR